MSATGSLSPPKEDRRPVAVALYTQTPNEPRLPIPGGGRTKPGMRYLIARMQEGGRIFVYAGPFRSAFEAERALLQVPVRPVAVCVSESEAGDAP